MFEVSPDGKNISLIWDQPILDTHHGGVVLVDGYLYGSNWISNSQGNWVCVDWNTGEVKYEKEWETKGSIIAADGLLYVYEERRGNVGLVKPDPENFHMVSSFRHSYGTGPHWAHPVIYEGLLYIRHGKTIAVYKIRKDPNG
jgi:outer membrane protein assembly factor BamB